MTERPILMNEPMVRALLAGTKTQTRRAMSERHRWHFIEDSGDLALCPYGQPGERLWVREAHYCFGHWETVPGMKTKAGRMKWRFVQDTGEVLYAPPESFRLGRHHKDPTTPAWHKRLARFMPRRYSRITLEITEVRVQRRQDISESDAWAEGITASSVSTHEPGDAVRLYRVLSESINGPGSWDANPWVWAISFRRITT